MVSATSREARRDSPGRERGDVTQMLPENHVSGLFFAVGNRNTTRFFRRREELYSSRLCQDFIAKESKTDAAF